jgi:hypothetical protein
VKLSVLIKRRHPGVQAEIVSKRLLLIHLHGASARGGSPPPSSSVRCPVLTQPGVLRALCLRIVPPQPGWQILRSGGPKGGPVSRTKFGTIPHFD